MPEILLNPFPPMLQPEDVKTSYIQYLTALIQAFDTGNVGAIPGLTKNALSALVLLPQAASTLKNVTGIVSDVVWWTWARAVEQHLADIANCVCEIAQQGPARDLRVLQVTVDEWPATTSVTVGQGGGPPLLYPLGWVNFSTNKGVVDRQFVNYPVQLFTVPNLDPTLTFTLWKKLGVQMHAQWIQ